MSLRETQKLQTKILSWFNYFMWHKFMIIIVTSEQFTQAKIAAMTFSYDNFRQWVATCVEIIEAPNSTFFTCL